MIAVDQCRRNVNFCRGGERDVKSEEWLTFKWLAR